MVDAEQPVYNIHRLRILDNEPYILEHTFMPANLVPGLKRGTPAFFLFMITCIKN